jgi:hypothetical protein
MALLGAILPAWGYHRDPPAFVAVGNFFLSLAAGIVAAGVLARRLMARRTPSFLLLFGCLLSCLDLLAVGMMTPPISWWWRAAGMFGLGIAGGLLNMGLFYAISPTYQADPAGTVNRGGIWYGLGCLAATMVVALYSEPSVPLIMAVAPAVFAILYARTSFAAPPEGTQPSFREALQDFRSVGAILFALLLFFQFGNEWSLAGWLPLLLMRRVGLSTSAALLTLALYWLCLMLGRLGAVAILPRVRHGRILFASVLVAMFGCVILYTTNNAFGAAFGAVFVGAGFAPIYPLVAEAIGRRFPYYHPGFFNGIFSLALVGGLLAPATLGYLAATLGVGVVMGLPLLGTFMVVTLLLLIWLETKVTGR